MKEIITNKYNLLERDMTEVVTRVKLLLVNSKDELLLGLSHNDYQFPGGHVEDNENLIDTINRELQEETGIVLNLKDIEPFAKLTSYYKDYPSEGKNRKIEIYYYEIITDELPNLKNTNYTEHEFDGNFSLVYIPLSKIEKILNENIKKYNDPRGIGREMLNLISIYKEQRKR